METNDDLKDALDTLGRIEALLDEIGVPHHHQDGALMATSSRVAYAVGMVESYKRSHEAYMSLLGSICANSQSH